MGQAALHLHFDFSFLHLLQAVDTFSIGHAIPVGLSHATASVAKPAGTVIANKDAVNVAARTNFLIVIFPPF
ncbi:hypothetical protein tpqmel_0128 [Candidatus Gastranaerophilus sp. (ex Termes propinquus)]|nr:hypothetical protein tpqmel_0128 [Candidatus Gastranaerophilus sp. (ex Termes propinquus)]